jgi:hypothetical protein
MINHKLVISLGDKEAEHGLTYVAFSRARRLHDIVILGDFTETRMITSIKTHAKMKPRKMKEARLRKVADLTAAAIKIWRLQQTHQMDFEEEDAVNNRMNK